MKKHLAALLLFCGLSGQGWSQVAVEGDTVYATFGGDAYSAHNEILNDTEMTLEIHWERITNIVADPGFTNFNNCWISFIPSLDSGFFELLEPGEDCVAYVVFYTGGMTEEDGIVQVRFTEAAGLFEPFVVTYILNDPPTATRWEDPFEGVVLFPNPAGTTVHLNFRTGDHLPHGITWYDAAGRSLGTVRPDRASLALDVTTFSPGVYFLGLTYEEGVRWKRVVVR